MHYAVVVEKTENNYSAYVPDPPGCVATGQTVEESENEIRAAIEFHIEGLRAGAWPSPCPSASLSILREWPEPVCDPAPPYAFRA
jgi:predicted RNase H-like HicB family nuclease